MRNIFFKIFNELKRLSPKANRITRSCPLKKFALFFDTEIITDKNGNDFVVLSDDYGDLNYEIHDKTEFEAVNNHIHILDHISGAELEEIKEIAMELCKWIQFTLQAKYPDKQFYVYATASKQDSFILRFHQQWENECPYYSPDIDYEDGLMVILPPNKAQ